METINNDLTAKVTWDVSVADFPRLAGETDDSPRFMRAYEGDGKNMVWIGSTASGGTDMAAEAAKLG